jgi:3-dehydroquinate synthase
MDSKRSIRNISLIGFSATGKSSVANRLAELLKWRTIDIDNEIVKRTGNNIEAIFQQEGENAFRRMEHEVLAQVLGNPCTVIATGGGIVIDPRNRELLRNNCLIVGLEATVDTIYRRLQEGKYKTEADSVRPLLNGNNLRESIIQLKSARQFLYVEIADETVHTDSLTIDEVSAYIASLWNKYNGYSESTIQGIWKDAACTVNTSGYIYPVFVGSGLIDEIGYKLSEAGLKGKAVIISDSNVYPLYGERCRKAIENKGFKSVYHMVPAGEKSKSHDVAVGIYDFLVTERIERNDVIIALGGGMAGDLAGFIAATYLRGVPWVQVPTTLIGMVDASIGGKVAINHPKGKNLIGSFYQPKMVLADINTLSTLPERELNSGWAEVVKHGMILDKDYFLLLESSCNELRKLDRDIISNVIARSAGIKAEIVSEDEKEKGKRIILNYGHTVAHGLETVTDYNVFLHGEAVSIGMMAAAIISNRLGMIEPDIIRRQRDVLQNFGLPVQCAGISIDDVIKRMQLDKKVKNESIRWVLLKDIGETEIIERVDTEIVIESLQEVIRT